MKLNMKEARRADYADYREVAVLKYSPMHYFFVILGFCISVVFPILFAIWTVLTSQPIATVVKTALCLVPIGFICFVISFRSKASCRQCGRVIEVYWCQESDERGRRSGPLAVCESCHAYEVRLTSDDIG